MSFLTRPVFPVAKLQPPCNSAAMDIRASRDQDEDMTTNECSQCLRNFDHPNAHPGFKTHNEWVHDMGTHNLETCRALGCDEYFRWLRFQGLEGRYTVH